MSDKIKRPSTGRLLSLHICSYDDLPSQPQVHTSYRSNLSSAGCKSANAGAGWNWAVWWRPRSLHSQVQLAKAWGEEEESQDAFPHRQHDKCLNTRTQLKWSESQCRRGRRKWGCYSPCLIFYFEYKNSVKMTDLVILQFNTFVLHIFTIFVWDGLCGHLKYNRGTGECTLQGVF